MTLLDKSVSPGQKSNLSMVLEDGLGKCVGVVGDAFLKLLVISAHGKSENRPIWRLRK